MNAEAFPDLSPTDWEYAQIWAESTARALESLHGSPFASTPRAAVAKADLPEAAASLWLIFRATGSLEGEQVFQISRSDAVRMAQLQMAQPMDATAAFSEVHAGALSEIFRQFAGLAAAACENKYGGEVRFQLQFGAAPEWKPAGYALGVFAAPQVQIIQWVLWIGAGLHAALSETNAVCGIKSLEEKSLAQPIGESASLPKPDVIQTETRCGKLGTTPEPTKAAVSTTAMTSSDQNQGAAPQNLDLLLDIELDASLRFGQREMLLREIIELRPGSVVELNREIQEPAELVVAGRVIARGEVVIVDGNYGLRITEIAQPRQRLQFLET